MWGAYDIPGYDEWLEHQMEEDFFNEEEDEDRHIRLLFEDFAEGLDNE